MHNGADYWEKKYQNKDTGWDIGHPSTPLTHYFDTIKDKSLKILIPGAGNAYEAEYLHNKGYNNVHIVDISKSVLQSFSIRVPSFPTPHIHNEDFFIHSGNYDIIIEQTFFCALLPELRNTYVEKMHLLLKKEGLLVGLLFKIPLYDDHPPYGGNKEEYIDLFSKKFNILKMETSYNSIPPRAGNELFIKLQKKEQ